jgi:hypothetical protein
MAASPPDCGGGPVGTYYGGQPGGRRIGCGIRQQVVVSGGGGSVADVGGGGAGVHAVCGRGAEAWLHGG